MCRFLVYKGRGPKQAVLVSDLVVRPSHGIIQQSYASRERLTAAGNMPPALNGDGFGIGWYTVQADGDVDGTSTAGADARAGAAASGGVGRVVGSARCEMRREPDSGGDGGPAPAKRPRVDGANAAAGAGPAAAAMTPPVVRETTAERAKRMSRVPGVFTSVVPAWNSDNLQRIADKISSSLVFAHVRAASPGSVIMEPNCHPFAEGRYMFMHNGFVAGFDKLRRRVLTSLSEESLHSLRGTSDSEHCFCLLLDIIRKLGPLDDKRTQEELESCVRELIETLEGMEIDAGVKAASLYNFALTDGETEDPKGDEGSFRMAVSDRREHVVIVASEALTAVSDDWLEVPPQTLMTIGKDMTVLLKPLGSRKRAAAPESDATVECGAEAASRDELAVAATVATRRSKVSDAVQRLSSAAAPLGAPV